MAIPFHSPDHQPNRPPHQKQNRTPPAPPPHLQAQARHNLAHDRHYIVAVQCVPAGRWAR